MGTGLMGGAQLPGRAGNHQQIGHQPRAMRTIPQMSPLRGRAAAIVFDQALLQLNTSHYGSPQASVSLPLLQSLTI